MQNAQMHADTKRNVENILVHGLWCTTQTRERRKNSQFESVYSHNNDIMLQHSYSVKLHLRDE